MPGYDIDNVTSDGLAARFDSIGYRIGEIERHLHHRERWYGKSAGDSFLDPDVLTEWQATSGIGEAFGAALQISNGDEIHGGNPLIYFDIHKVLVTAVSATNKVYKLQFLCGTGLIGDASICTEFVGFFPATGKSAAIEISMPRSPCNSKIWVKSACETNGATIDFIIGLHTYEV